jgi:hypothetical protein
LGIWFDFLTQVSSKGFVWGDSEFLLKERQFHFHNFFIIPPGGQGATLFLKELFGPAFIREKYKLLIPDLVRRNKESFFRTIEPFFDKKDIQEMFQICINGEWKKSYKKRKRWWRKLVIRGFIKKPLLQTSHSLSFSFF